MRVMLNAFPGGKTKALTMSYDDGPIHDKRLAGIFDANGIKGTFHINSGRIPFSAEEFREIYKNHEVSSHTVTHPFLELIPREEALNEMIEDRRALEKLAGYPVRGMSYPYGTYNNDVIALARAAGMEYSRTTVSTRSFNLPSDYLMWHPTCHHDGGAMELLDSFLKLNRASLNCFYVWGHSFEFANKNNWELIESFCDKAGNHDDIWYATNIEIVDYAKALKELRFSVDRKFVYNPTALDLWINVDNGSVKIESGKTVAL